MPRTLARRSSVEHAQVSLSAGLECVFLNDNAVFPSKWGEWEVGKEDKNELKFVIYGVEVNTKHIQKKRG